MAELEKKIKIWTQILNNEDALKHVMKTELKIIKKEYANERRTKIRDEITEIKLDMMDMIPKENTIVVVTNEGYIKRVSQKSYASRGDDETTLKPGDFIIGLFEVTTQDTILVFTNLGNYLYIPVHKIPDAKWKELGKHINNIISLSEEEQVVYATVMDNKEDNIIIATKNGLIKKSKIGDYEVTRYSKPMAAIKLKDDDLVVDVMIEKKDVLLFSKLGYCVRFDSSEIPLTGIRSAGVKGMNLKDDELVSAVSIDSEDYIDLFTSQKTAKRIKVSEIDNTGRAKRGSAVMKKVKSVSYEIIKALSMDARDIVLLKSDSEIKEIKNSDITIMDLASTGSNITKNKIDAIAKKMDMVSFLKKEVKEEKTEQQTNTEKVKELTIDDFLDDFKL